MKIRSRITWIFLSLSWLSLAGIHWSGRHAGEKSAYLLLCAGLCVACFFLSATSAVLSFGRIDSWRKPEGVPLCLLVLSVVAWLGCLQPLFILLFGG